MTDETYNGWSNRETWALVLHINNDQSLQEWALELTEQLIGYHGPKAPLIGERIVDGFEDTLAEAAEEGSEQARWAFTVMGDVGSFWRIDPVEVGESFIEAVGE
jgi:hypothetical protein